MIWVLLCKLPAVKRIVSLLRLLPENAGMDETLSKQNAKVPGRVLSN